MRISKLWNDLESSLLFRPTLWVVGLGLLAVLLMQLDSRLSSVLTFTSRPLFLTGGAEGARTMLGSISSAMLTVTSLTFSIMMVAVIQTANAYSPRVLREFLSDTPNQHVLGVLIGTFLFSLLVLRGVRSTEELVFVPVLATNVALVLSLLSTAAFIYFINHVAHSIKVSNVVTLILKNTEELVADIFPTTLGEPWPEKSAPPLPQGESAVIASPGSGYIQFIEPKELMAVARRADIVVRLEHAVGDYVLTGVPLATVWPASAVNAQLAREVQRAIALGPERTLVQDVLFGVRHLSDIALRALSEAINDPTTAIDCINALATLMVRLVEREPVSPYRCDTDGRLRVIARKLTFAQMLDEAFSQVYLYAVKDVVVMLRLLEVCGELGYVTSDAEEHRVLWEFAQMIRAVADQHVEVPRDRQKVNACLLRAASILGQEAGSQLLAV